MSDDVSRRLDEAGRRPIPPPDPAFATALEARILEIAGDLARVRLDGSSVTRVRARRAAAGSWIAAAGIAAVVLAVVALGVAGPDLARRDAPALQGINVEVVLANGTVLEDPDGLLLPEGAIVRVGAGGFARIGAIELGPGDVATVGRGGGIQLVHSSPIAVATDPSQGRTPSPDRTSASATGSPASSSAPASPSPAPDPTKPPAATTGPTRPPTTTASTAAPTPTPTPAILRPRLRAILVDGPRIAVRWTATWSAARYVLVATASRSGPAPDPTYPGSRILGEFAAPPVRALRYRVPQGVVEVRLMVVALREDGRILRRSRIVTVAIPAPVDPMASSPAPSRSPSPAPPSVTDPSPTPAP